MACALIGTNCDTSLRRVAAGVATATRSAVAPRRRKKDNLPVLRVPGVVLSRRVFAMRGVLSVMKTLVDERYVVVQAYKCTVSEIWRDFSVLAYIACTSRGHSYQIARRNATLVGWLFLPSGKKVHGVAIWYLQGF